MDNSVYLLLLLVQTVVTGQAPGDEDTHCTEFLPSLNPPRNVFVDPPNVVPLMDSSHYFRLLPPNYNPVWQSIDLDNNNPAGWATTVSVLVYIIVQQNPVVKCCYYNIIYILCSGQNREQNVFQK